MTINIKNRIQDVANQSSYFLFTEGKDNGVDVDRIKENETGSEIYYLRVKNNTSQSVKINSFVVLDFGLPKDIHPIEVLEHGWLNCSEVNYKKLDCPTKENAVILRRDQNHFSFKENYGYLKNSVVSEWFTEIKISSDLSLFIGAVTTADQFSQIYIQEDKSGLVKIRVTCQFDGLKLSPGEVVKSEKIFVSIGNSKEVKSKFAKSLAKHMSVGNVKEPIKTLVCSYYYNGNNITEESVNKEVDAIEKLPKKLDIDYIELDAGYTKLFGDWLNYKENFPNGFEKTIKRIKNLGYKPAIWISPFSINAKTADHLDHKFWFIKGNKYDSHMEARASSPVDSMVPILDLEVYDPTNEKFRDYLKEILIHFKSVGFEMINIDFMYPVCLNNNYSKKVTRAQALRSGIKLIRDTLGNNFPIHSCITQLSPVVGLVDYVRTGIDTLNPFVTEIPLINSYINNFMLNKDLTESKERSFLNGIVWRANPDVLIFRDNTGIDESLLVKHRRFAKENNMCMWIGDSIANLSDGEKNKILDFFND